MAATDEVKNYEYERGTSTVLATLSAWKKALVTKEDNLFSHKVLGVLVVLSFGFRLSQFSSDMAFPAHPGWTLPTLALHWMLTASSFQFKIPQRRIRDGGRVWPQYRWHSLIFTTRCILILALYWYEQRHGLEPNYDANFFIVLLGLVAADCVNYAVGEEFCSNTMRELDGPAAVKFIYSAALFHVTVFFIMGLRFYAVPFYGLVPIQMTPFVGTLRRKRVMTSDFLGAFIFGSILVGGFATQAYYYHRAGGERMHLFGRSIALLAAFLRLSPLPYFCYPLQNKYFIWTLMYLIVRQVRPVIGDLNVVKLRLLVLALIASLAVSGYIKVTSGYYPSNVLAAKKKKAAAPKTN